MLILFWYILHFIQPNPLFIRKDIYEFLVEVDRAGSQTTYFTKHQEPIPAIKNKNCVEMISPNK